MRFANINPAMREVLIANGSAAATISAVGGFVTRLALDGEDLLHFNADEDARAIPGAAHYGAPFVAPPGVNEGYERHGPWRTRLWSINARHAATAILSYRIGAHEIIQQFTLRHPRELETTVTAVNHDPAAAFPFECGLHYYWAVDHQHDLDVGRDLSGHFAWDNVAREIVRTTDLLVRQEALDLHIISGEPTVRFTDRRRRHRITLTVDAPSQRTTCVLYAPPGRPHFRAIEQWTAPQEMARGTWAQLAHAIAPGASAVCRFTVRKD